LWRKALSIAGGLPRDPQKILTTINQFALVDIERGRDFFFRIVPRVLVRLEFSVAAIAHANHRGGGYFYDPQASYRHDPP